MNAEPSLVAFCLLGDISRNSRALRQIDCLVDAGFQVHAVGFTKAQASRTSGKNCEIHLLPYPQSSGPSLFLKAHRLLQTHLRHVSAKFYHASDLYSLPATAAASARETGRTYLTYDARELYPHVESLAKSPLKSYFWKSVEKHLVGKCDHIFTVSNGIANTIAASYSVRKPTVVYNCPDVSNQISTPINLRDQVDDPDDLVIIHNGQIRPGRGCISLARAIKHTKNTTLVFLGDGPVKSQIIQYASESGLQHKIRFVDPVPPNMVLSVTKQASIGATVLEDSCLNHKLALPNKLFEYIAAGIPVLASDLPEMASLVKSRNVGTVINPANPLEIAECLNNLENNRQLLDTWKKSTASASETFSWKKASEAFSQAFLSLDSSS